MNLLTFVRVCLFAWSVLCFTAHATLKIVTELSPPHQTIEENKVAGASTALVKKLLNEAKLEANFELLPWARAYRQASTDANTLIYSLARTEERERLFVWIGPVAIFELGLVRKSARLDLQIGDLVDLNNHKVAVQRGDIAAHFFTNRGIEVIETSDIQSSYQLLVNDRVDFVIDDPRLVVDMATLLKVPNNEFTFVMPVAELSVKGYLAANKNLPSHQISALQKAYTNLSNNPEVQRLLLSHTLPSQGN